MLVYDVQKLQKHTARVITTRALGIFLTCLAETAYRLERWSSRQVQCINVLIIHSFLQCMHAFIGSWENLFVDPLLYTFSLLMHLHILVGTAGLVYMSMVINSNSCTFWCIAIVRRRWVLIKPGLDFDKPFFCAHLSVFRFRESCSCWSGHTQQLNSAIANSQHFLQQSCLRISSCLTQ